MSGEQSLIQTLRVSARIARERDQLTAIPLYLEKAADRIEELEVEIGQLKKQLEELR